MELVFSNYAVARNRCRKFHDVFCGEDTVLSKPRACFNRRTTFFASACSFSETKCTYIVMHCYRNTKYKEGGCLYGYIFRRREEWGGMKKELISSSNQILEIRPFSNVCSFMHTIYEALPWHIPKYTHNSRISTDTCCHT